MSARPSMTRVYMESQWDVVVDCPRCACEVELTVNGDMATITSCALPKECPSCERAYEAEDLLALLIAANREISRYEPRDSDLCDDESAPPSAAEQRETQATLQREVK